MLRSLPRHWTEEAMRLGDIGERKGLSKRGSDRGCWRQDRWTACCAAPPTPRSLRWRVDGPRRRPCCRRNCDRLLPWRRRQRHDVRAGPVPQWQRATIGRQCGRWRSGRSSMRSRGSWGEGRVIPATTSRGRVGGGSAPHSLYVQRVEHRELRGWRCGMSHCSL